MALFGARGGWDVSGSERARPGTALGQAARACRGTAGCVWEPAPWLALVFPGRPAGLQMAVFPCLSVLPWLAELLRGEHELLAQHTQPPGAGAPRVRIPDLHTPIPGA